MKMQCEIYFRDLFLEVHEDNLDILSRTKEINLHILGQMMPFLETFLQMNEERGDETVDPTNVPVERVFGVVKYAKKNFSTHLPSIGSAKLEEYHSQISEIEKRITQDHSQTFSLLHKESLMRYFDISLIFIQ